MDDLLIVLSNPRDGRDDEFNEWYSNVHIRDVMRLPGSSAVQRLKLTAEQVPSAAGIAADRTFGYLAVYECDDIERISAGHAVVFSQEMLISDSFDFAMREGYYRPSIYRQKASVDRHAGDLVIERIDAAAGDGLAEWYDRERMPALMALPGVVSGTFCRVTDHQMLEPNPDSVHIALYRTQSRAATLAGWASAPALPGGHVAQVACYEPLMERLPARAVVHADPAARAAEAKARMALGDKVYPGFPEGPTLA
ncbi:MAG: hypothetical protein RIS94_1885 [Pseudomonadota bacterium]|jgi:hypothetical protein